MLALDYNLFRLTYIWFIMWGSYGLDVQKAKQVGPAKVNTPKSEIWWGPKFFERSAFYGLGFDSSRYNGFGSHSEPIRLVKVIKYQNIEWNNRSFKIII